MTEKRTLREELSDLAHEQWTAWMTYLFSISEANSDGSVTIPPQAVERWQRQIKTPYEDLSELEKNSDRKEADKVISMVVGGLTLMKDA